MSPTSTGSARRAHSVQYPPPTSQRSPTARPRRAGRCATPAAQSTPTPGTSATTLLGVTGSAAPGLVQIEACFGTSASDSSPVCTMPSDIQFDQSAFGDSYATASAGPGGVALLTGDYSISAVDASVTSYLGGMSVGRSLTTLAPADAGVSPAAQRSDTSGVFGPGWTPELAGPAA